MSKQAPKMSPVFYVLGYPRPARPTGGKMSNSKKLIAEAKKALKASTRIDGHWNHWLNKDGTLHAEYQCGTDALFTLEKRGKKVSLVGVK